MSKTESLLVGTFLCLTVPFLFFVAGWWGPAALAIYHVIAIPEKAIAVCAFAGLALGIAVTVLKLRRWVGGFYAMPRAITVPFYLFWFAVMSAFCMGVPLGNVALGALVGLYVGRRVRHARREAAACESGSGSLEGESGLPRNRADSPEGASCPVGNGANSLDHAARRAALFTAAVTAGAYVPLGILAVQDQTTLATLLSFAGIGGLAATSAGLICVVALAVPALAVIEYYLTRVSARVGYRLGAGEA